MEKLDDAQRRTFLPWLWGRKRITAETIRADAERFSRLHSWNKHIQWPGQMFVVGFRIGEEPRHPVSPEVSDTTGLHLTLTRTANGRLPGAVFLTPLLGGAPGHGEIELLVDPALEQAIIHGEKHAWPGKAIECFVAERERQRMVHLIVDMAVKEARALGYLADPGRPEGDPWCTVV